MLSLPKRPTPLQAAANAVRCRVATWLTPLVSLASVQPLGARLTVSRAGMGHSYWCVSDSPIQGTIGYGEVNPLTAALVARVTVFSIVGRPW